MRITVGVLLCVSAAAVGARATVASLRPERVHVADDRKTQAYVRDGIIVGGDHAVNEVIVKDIRHAMSTAGYERIVIDLEGNSNGEPLAIPRPPYFQMSVTPDEKRAVMTIWGHPRLDFDAKKIRDSFKKSQVVGKIQLYPKMEENSWTFSMGLKPGHPIEVFELTNPVRIIVDIRSGRARK